MKKYKPFVFGQLSDDTVQTSKEENLQLKKPFSFEVPEAEKALIKPFSFEVTESEKKLIKPFVMDMDYYQEKEQRKIGDSTLTFTNPANQSYCDISSAGANTSKTIMDNLCKQVDIYDCTKNEITNILESCTTPKETCNRVSQELTNTDNHQKAVACLAEQIGQMITTTGKQDCHGKQEHREVEFIVSEDKSEIIVTYSNNYCKKSVYNELKGPIMVSRFRMQDTPIDQDRFWIRFSSGQIIFGKCKGLNEENLYKCFALAGIKLNSDIPKKASKEALFNYFYSMINNTKNISVIDGRAGWCNGIWICAENNPYTEREVIQDMPLMHKSFFYEANISRENMSDFFRMITELTDETNRIVFLETMVSGLLASILREKGIEMKYFLNLVVEEQSQIENLCKLFQVFNRKTMDYFNVTGKQSVEGYLKSSKDEVLILLYQSDGASEYMKKKGKNNINMIVQETYCGKTNASVVILNTEEYADARALNIYVGSSFITDKMSRLLREDIVGQFVNEFVYWAQMYMREIVGYIEREADRRATSYNVVWEIIKKFAEHHKLTLNDELDLSETIAPQVVIEHLLEDTEVIIEEVIDIIRRGIHNFYILPKASECYKENACYYSKTDLWIPVSIFQKILQSSKIYGIHSEQRFLACLRKHGICSNPKKQITSIKIGGTTVKAYKLKVDELNQDGKVSVLNLGKEDDKDVKRPRE